MTNKVSLRTIEEFMQDYKPIYNPIYPLFMDKAQAWSEEVGLLNFKRATTIGDIRAKHITPKDTEMRQVSVNEGTKAFKKYFLANQYQQSALQDRKGIEDVMSQVLDEHQKQFDELFLLGEGTSDSTMINNGLFWSGDENYDLENNLEVDNGDEHDPLIDLHQYVMAMYLKAEQVDGRKVCIFYGEDILPLFDSVYAANPVPFKNVLFDVLDRKVPLLRLPTAVTPSGESGFIIANLDQVKLHYTALPSLKAQGVNDEKMYSWHNFMMGSSMLEVLAANAIIRQPLTIEA